MDVRNCKKCGKIFNHITGPDLCPSCMKKDDEKFQEVKQYIYDNPGVGVSEVSEAMEVSIAQIRHWVREERLEFAEGSVSGIQCERCGKIINTGRFCKRCKDEMVHSFGSVYKTPETETNGFESRDSAKMRFFTAEKK